MAVTEADLKNAVSTNLLAALLGRSPGAVNVGGVTNLILLTQWRDAAVAAVLQRLGPSGVERCPPPGGRRRRPDRGPVARCDPRPERGDRHRLDAPELGSGVPALALHPAVRLGEQAMRWPRLFRGIEDRALEAARRELRSYTEGQLVRTIATASGSTATPDPRRLAAVEASAGLVGRAMSMGRPEAPGVSPAILGALSAGFLADVGRALIESGEAVYDIDVETMAGRARVELIRAADYTLRGSRRPSTWMYDLTLAGPTSLEAMTRPAEGVVHVRINLDPGRPWRGRSPLDLADQTSGTLAAADQSLGAELSGPVGSLVPVPRVDEEKGRGGGGRGSIRGDGTPHRGGPRGTSSSRRP